MRRLILLFCAVLVTVGMSLPRQLIQAKPAYALNDCAPNQGDDQVYERTDLYKSSKYWVWDSNDPTIPGHWVDIDLRTYQVSHGGQCWRGYRVGVWTEDGAWGSIIPRERAWVCGTYGGAFQRDLSNGPWSYVVTTGAWSPSPTVTYNVQMPTGEIIAMTFAGYGSWTNGTLCNPQADSYQSWAAWPTWYNPSYLYSLPGGCNCWYVNE